jgi:7-cyano-7-deazaguanine synthase
MIVVLCSGGVDSTVLAMRALREKRLHSVVFIAFGQPAVDEERRAVLLWGERFGVPVVELGCPLRGSMAIGVGVAGPRVMAGRNLALIAWAVNYAAENGVREVQFGAIGDDAKDYTDCRPEFVGAVGDLCRRAYGVDVRAPLLDTTKPEVIAEAAAFKILDGCWSCYQPRGGVPCGACASCVSRGAR